MAMRPILQPPGLLLAPFVWVAVELARTRITGFPWDLLGITQVDNIPLAHIATVTGVYGLSFEIMVVNTAMAAAFVIRRREAAQQTQAALAGDRRRGRCVASWKTDQPAAVLPTDHTARLVQQNIPILQGGDWTKEYFEGTLRDLSRISLTIQWTQQQIKRVRVRRVHPDLIVWPESPAPFYTTDPAFPRNRQQHRPGGPNLDAGGEPGQSQCGRDARTRHPTLQLRQPGQPGGEWVGATTRCIWFRSANMCPSSVCSALPAD